MTKKYLQLTLPQRYQVEALYHLGLSQTAIAELVGCHRSTICRELQRNMPKRGRGANLYDAHKAQQKTERRHAEKQKHIRFTDELKAETRYYLEEEKQSPEFIVALWAKKGKKGVSHETIYKLIWDGKKSNKKEHLPDKQLYRHLKHGRRRRKRGNYKDSRGLIPNRVSIEQRPAVVEERSRLGDIEVDLIVGKDHKGGLLVTLDRASLKVTIDKFEHKTARQIKRILMKRMSKRKGLQTMTFDNDQAFSLHEKIAKTLKVQTFFTRPYTSQDKGSIENRNGVIRRFFPKKTNFEEVSDEEVKNVERLINNRPIRKFKYQSANEVHLIKSRVALTG